MAWSERELIAHLKEAGWTRIKGPARAFASPTHKNVHFSLDNYDTALNGTWGQYFAANEELPSTEEPVWTTHIRTTHAQRSDKSEVGSTTHSAETHT